MALDLQQDLQALTSRVQATSPRPVVAQVVRQDMGNDSGGLSYHLHWDHPSFGRGSLSYAHDSTFVTKLPDCTRCFRPVLTHVQTLWELMLLGEPLVVLAPSPDVSSELVLALTRYKLYPLDWHGCTWLP